MYKVLEKLMVAAVVCTAILWSAEPAGASSSVAIFVSAVGSDASDGLTAETAVKSLQRAFNIAYRYVKEGAHRVTIQVLPGRYVQQSVTIGRPPAAADFVVQGTRSGTERPVFDGQKNGRTWFVLKAKDQNGAKFRFADLEVANYFTAMSFEGDREDPGRYLSNNAIERMVFRNIGQLYSNNPEFSTAALRFVNARDNIVKDNRFINIRNRRGCYALHAIYLAHHSSGNRIEGNLFQNACGSPIRVRDASNNNIVEGNVFRAIEYDALFDEWYCNRARTEGCTKKSVECPSWGNRYRDNSVESSSAKAMRSPVAVHVPEVVQGCEKGGQSSGTALPDYRIAH